MSERFRIGITEIDGNESESPINDACVANTVVSICSKLSGEEFRVPNIYYKWRQIMEIDMLRMANQHQRRNVNRNLPHREPSHYRRALRRLDQRSVMQFIAKAKDGYGVPLEAALIQTVLQDAEINTKRGGLEEIKQDLERGRQVAVMYQVPDPDSNSDLVWHIAHIGKTQNGELLSFSDGDLPLDPSDLARIDEAHEYLNGDLRTWNYISVNKTGD